jgi:hypothetical protein
MEWKGLAVQKGITRSLPSFFLIQADVFFFSTVNIALATG